MAHRDKVRCEKEDALYYCSSKPHSLRVAFCTCPRRVQLEESRGACPLTYRLCESISERDQVRIVCH